METLLIKRLRKEEERLIKLRTINMHTYIHTARQRGGRDVEVFEPHLGLIVNTSTDVWHTRVTGRHRDA